MKLVPILGTLVLLGAVVQVILGLEITASYDVLTGIHIILGLTGLVLVLVLVGIAFRTKTATIYSKLVIIILAVIVLIQVGLGFQLLGGADALALSHEANGFVIIIVSLLMGGITFWTSRRKLG